jgi:hypothetical protein
MRHQWRLEFHPSSRICDIPGISGCKHRHPLNRNVEQHPDGKRPSAGASGIAADSDNAMIKLCILAAM